MVRFSGEFLILSPSLIAEPQHIEIIIEALKKAIRSIA
jgi:adenosylmethionine-8-amino-7-oxononanoate aminotransferase